VDEPTSPEVPEGMTLCDPVAWWYLPRDVKRASLGFAVASAAYVAGFPTLFLLRVPELRWLGLVAIVAGAAGMVVVGGVALRWWRDERRLVRSSARRMILLGAALLVATPLGYWFFVIPQL
jgi:hypothetical protein